MKTLKTFIFIPFLTICVSSAVFPKTPGPEEIQYCLSKVESLVKSKKYHTAFTYLNEFDPDNKYPDIFMKKNDIALNYFITSINHMLFAFKDLKENETIDNLRGKNLKLPVYKLQIVKTLSRYIKADPDNYSYKKALGYFYFDYYNKFERNKGAQANHSFLSRSFDLLKEAEDNNVYDYKSLHIIGYVYYLNNDLKKALTYFIKSDELNPGWMNNKCLLSLTCFKLKKDNLAISHGKQALLLNEEDNFLKAKIAQMLSIIYNERNDMENANKYIELAKKYSE